MCVCVRAMFIFSGGKQHLTAKNNIIGNGITRLSKHFNDTNNNDENVNQIKVFVCSRAQVQVWCSADIFYELLNIKRKKRGKSVCVCVCACVLFLLILYFIIYVFVSGFQLHMNIMFEWLLMQIPGHNFRLLVHLCKLHEAPTPECHFIGSASTVVSVRASVETLMLYNNNLDMNMAMQVIKLRLGHDLTQ